MSFLEGLSTSLTGSKNAFAKPGSPSAGPAAPRAATPVGPGALEYQPNDYGLNPQSYEGTFQTAFSNLGQPGAVSAGDVNAGTLSLSNAFVDAFHKKTGQLPTADQVREFVAQNLNTGFASRAITGQNNPDQITSNIVNPYFQANPQLFGQQNASSDITNQMQGLNDQVNTLYGQAGQNITKAYDEGFAEPRRQAISDEAALGRLRSPASIPTIAGVDTARETGKSQALAGLYGNQVNASLDIGKTVQGLLANERRAGEQVQQFGQSYGLAKNAQAESIYNDDYTRGLYQQTLGLASQLGQMQANGQKNDGLSGAFGGGISGASAGSSFGPWGALAGGVGGGLLGYFGSKKG